MERFWISRKATGYRWFPLWLVLGVGLAVVLLVNSVWNYVSISHRIVVDQVRKDMWLQVAGIDRTMQRGGFRDARMLEIARTGTAGKQRAHRQDRITLGKRRCDRAQRRRCTTGILDEVHPFADSKPAADLQNLADPRGNSGCGSFANAATGYRPGIVACRGQPGCRRRAPSHGYYRNSRPAWIAPEQRSGHYAAVC